MKNRVGEIHISSEGYEVEVVEYFNAKNCTIKIGEQVFKNKDYTQVKSGYVKNPLNYSVKGIGCLGAGEYKSRKDGKHTKPYLLWYKIIKKCSEDKNTTVSEDWRNYQNFAKFYYKNYKKDCRLYNVLFEKDISHYSEKTCDFLPVILINLVEKFTLGGHVVVLQRGRWYPRLSYHGNYIGLGSSTSYMEAVRRYYAGAEILIRLENIKWEFKINRNSFEYLRSFQFYPKWSESQKEEISRQENRRTKNLTLQQIYDEPIEDLFDYE